MVRVQNPAADVSVARHLQREVRLQEPRTLNLVVGRARTLDELETQFTAICERFRELVASAGCELCIRPPAPGSWSVAQCLRHLNASADAYFPIWQQVISNAGPRREAPSAPYRIDFWGRLLSWILEPPPRIRSKTPVPFEPLHCSEITPVFDGFLDRQRRIVTALHRCRGRAIDKVRISSPVDARIHYSIWSSFLINVAHQRRHLWQAEQAIWKLRKMD